MPEMDGIEFLSQLRNQDIKPEIVMVTGNPSMDNCIDSVRYNACQYLIKPTSREDILKSLEQAKERIAVKKDIIKRGLYATGNI